MPKDQLPPGIRFHPTDEELIVYYLRRKVQGKKLHFTGISVVDIYKYAPWDLPEKSGWRSGDKKWFFFCLREKKYASGSRMNRSTDLGYWKTTGKDRSVKYRDTVVGTIKTLVFHRGKPPNGNRTDWVMYEYSLQNYDLVDENVNSRSYVLCAVFEKNGKGPRNGAQYGAPFCEEDWKDDCAMNLMDVNSSEACQLSNLVQHALVTPVSVDTTVSLNSPFLDPSSERPKALTTTSSFATVPCTENVNQFSDPLEDDIDFLLKYFVEDHYDGLCGDLGKSIVCDKFMTYASTSDGRCPAGLSQDHGSYVELTDFNATVYDTEAFSKAQIPRVLDTSYSCKQLPHNTFEECRPCAQNADLGGENKFGTSGETRETKVSMYKRSINLFGAPLGISLIIKAEVTVKTDGCTKDALIQIAQGFPCAFYLIHILLIMNVSCFLNMIRILETKFIACRGTDCYIILYIHLSV